MKIRTEIELLHNDLVFYQKRMVDAHAEVRRLKELKDWSLSQKSDEQKKNKIKVAEDRLKREVERFEATDEKLRGMNEELARSLGL